MVQTVRQKRRETPPSPEFHRTSRQRRHVSCNFNINDEEEEGVGRRVKKKPRLSMFEENKDNGIFNRRVSHAPSFSPASFSSEDDDDDEIRRRNLVEEEDDDEEEEEKGGSDYYCGKVLNRLKRVPMPDRKRLELILDKLQKKDTYGVYAKPVDPDELPGYCDVIKHPMDFRTVRKKLAKGLYLSLKEFENDVFLICTNAMQYNALDTVYYKQAISIKELAKLKFQRLRANTNLSEKELKSDRKSTPSFTLPRKQLRKSMPWTTPDPQPVGTETLSGPIPARPNSGEILIADNSPLGYNNCDNDQEPLPGKEFTSKLGRKPSAHDENRRATYNISLEPVADSDSVLSTFDGQCKQFIPVGLHVEHSYARSLSRFAATLGPVAWKIACHTIEQVLPEGVQFGPGWVDEYEPLLTPVLVPGNRTFKEPNFLTHFKITSDVRNNKKASQTPEIHVDVKEANGGLNPGILLMQESPRQTRKDPILSPSPRTSLLSGSNLMHQNSHAGNFTARKSTGLPQVLPMDSNMTPRWDLQGLTAPVQMMKMVAENSQDQQSYLTDTNSKNEGFVPGRQSKPVGLDHYRMVPMDSNMTPRRDLQGLSDPVHVMKILAENNQHLQDNSKGFGFVLKSSNNGALTAAQAWMPVGGAATATGCFIKPHKQQISADSLYSLNHDRLEPQVTRFHDEFNAYQQPVRQLNESQLQNRTAGFPPMVTTAGLSRFQVQSGWRGIPPQMHRQLRPKHVSHPPDLNIGHQSVRSPVRHSAGIMVDSQQPDLALQL